LENIYSAPKADLSEVSFMDATYEPKLFALKGRVGRARYVGFSIAYYLITLLAFGVAAGVMGLVSALGVLLMVIVGIAATVLYVALTVRRLNDLNHTGWLSLLMLIPFVGAFLALYVLFAPGTKGTNDYGLAPTKNTTTFVICAAILPAIVVIGIVAAVALPAYQDYTKRAKAAQLEQAQPQPEFSQPNQQ
jgi:uncharacterized membrane protein YhaH (DUF805 family)